MPNLKNARLALGLLGALALSACASSTTATTANCLLDAGQNAGSCPKTWADARALCSTPTACGTIGAQCAYPGAGDQLGNCTATAVLLCAAMDGGQGQWLCAQ